MARAQKLIVSLPFFPAGSSMSLGLSAPARSVNFALSGGETSHRDMQHMKDVIQRLEQQLMQRFSKSAASRRSEGSPMQPWTSDPAAFSPLLLAYDARIAEMTDELLTARARHEEQRLYLEKVSAHNQELTSLVEALREQAASASLAASSSSRAPQGDSTRFAQAVPLLERKVAELESVIQLLQTENENQAKQLARGSHRVGHVQAVAETATDQVKYMQQQLADSQAAFQQCKMELDSVSQSCVALKGAPPAAATIRLFQLDLTQFPAANDNLRSHSESASRALQAKQRQVDDSNDSFRHALPDNIETPTYQNTKPLIMFLTGECMPTLCGSSSKRPQTTTML